jgi:immunoglobulin-like protein involved in spore germination
LRTETEENDVDPRDRDIEQRLRSALGAAGDEPPLDDAWNRLDRRLLRDPWKRAGTAVLAVAAVTVLGFVSVPRILDLGKPDAGAPAGRVDTTPEPKPSPSPAVLDAGFPGFYPVTTYTDAKRLQDSVDNGHQPLILDPAEVARQFARDYIGWQAVKLGTVTRTGSSQDGWKAMVELRPYIGEAQPPTQLGTRHVVELMGLPGADDPTWFVTAIRSDNIVIDSSFPPGSPVASPVPVSGRGVGFEGTINTVIKDDRNTILHPRKNLEEGYLQAGSTELLPFEGNLGFDRPETPEGVLILTGASGLGGPAPDWTIVRLRFLTG